MNEVVLAIVASVITGAVSTLGTIGALRVHITYLRENVVELKGAVTRAHSRIDMIERKRHA